MTRAAVLAVVLLLSAGLAGDPSLAQQRAARPPPAKEEPPPPAPLPPAIYEPDLLRLSEVIGALAFLRDLCGAPDVAEWPARMQALLEAEGGSPERRERLAGAYNRGYRGFALTYRICTPSADLAIARYLDEGERLSRMIAGRYGG